MPVAKMIVAEKGGSMDERLALIFDVWALQPE
jgi:hypothetical protein